MALPTAAARNLACSNCRQWMLRTFIASIGGSGPHTPATSNRRAFSTSPRRLNEARERLQKEEKDEHALNDIVDEKKAWKKKNNTQEDALEDKLETSTEQPAQDAHVPWYLQVESPVPQQDNAFSARQKVPDLPEHPPAILQPLLERISVELGMDDLSLLDLRGIDPPPALGNNLLMIVGTARSEKHLHFSADKLCRWLRSEHRMSPYADGLLGRQELKLKMRRKAKRSRLLSAVGAKATADTDLDEGIRTGWICVNVGRVEGGELPKTEADLEREKNIVGFSSQTTGAQIVVQLLTEEKRGELDLEKVWTAVLRNSNRAKEALLAKEEPETSEEQSGPILEQAAQDQASTIPEQGEQQHHQDVYNPLPTSGLGQQQARAYHTSARRLQAAPIDQSPMNDDHSVALGSISRDSERSVSTATSLLNALAKMPHATAMEALGEDFMALPMPLQSRDTVANDNAPGSTTFVQAFYAAMPTFATLGHWHAHIELLCQAYNLGHPNVTDEKLLSTVENMSVAGFVPMETTFITVLVALLRNFDHGHVEYESKLAAIFNLLEDMEISGYNAVRPEILELLHRTLVGPPSDITPTTLQSLVPSLGLARLKRNLQSENLLDFWKTWNSYPRRFRARPTEMYVVLYDALAEDKFGLDYNATRDIIGYWISEMEYEDPPVMVEEGGVELAMSMFKAMKFVDPSSEMMEWNEIRERCEKVLRAALEGQ